MYCFAVIEVISLSGHFSNIDSSQEFQVTQSNGVPPTKCKVPRKVSWGYWNEMVFIINYPQSRKRIYFETYYGNMHYTLCTTLVGNVIII